MVTALEASTKLVEFFRQNDAFSMDADFKKIVLISDTEADEACVLAALDEIAKTGFVIKKHFNNKEYWILAKPLTFQIQSINIPLLLAIEISELINKIEPEDATRCNPLDITAEDIFHLLMLVKKR